MSDKIAFALRHYIGETPAFDSAHVAIDLNWPRRLRWSELRLPSIAAAEEVARIIGDTKVLPATASLVRSARPEDPFVAWLDAFARTFHLPGWRRLVEAGAPESVRIRVACPYVAELRRWTTIARDLLELGSAIARGETLTIDRDEWKARMERIGRGLPAPGQMLLHAVSTANKLPWGWAGDDRTVIGWGSRQKVVTGGGRHARTLSQALSDMDVHIPIYTINGSLGKTTTTRFLTQMLESADLRLGLTTSDGAFANGERLGEGDCIDGRHALAVLQRRDIDLAILEVGRGGIISQGIPYADVDVAILMNVLPMHLDQYGIDTVEAIADIKALSLKRARITVLNRDDGQCRRLAATRDPMTCIWFSTTAAAEELRLLSTQAMGVVGIGRNSAGAPAHLEIWQAGASVVRLPLAGIAPYHGMLGEKTVEELAAAVGAAWFGPVPLQDWDSMLKRLHLDNQNHRFRTSPHRRGNVLFVLDKAGDPPPLDLLETAIADLCAEHRIGRRIAVFTRSARRPPDRHRICCAKLHGFMDEFICFDRPETYSEGGALPIYEPGSIVSLLAAEMERLNREAGVMKPVSAAADWQDVELRLRSLADPDAAPVLILINQPATAAAELNRRIFQFVNNYPE